MKILIVFDCDNGYSCNCCGREWQEVEIYDIQHENNIWGFMLGLNKQIDDNYANNGFYGRTKIANAYVIEKELDLAALLDDGV